MSREGDMPHILEGYVVAESANAMKFECHKIDGNDWDPENQKTHWFPFSQITRIVKEPKGSQEFDSITVKRWILRTKGLM